VFELLSVGVAIALKSVLTMTSRVAPVVLTALVAQVATVAVKMGDE